MHMPKQTEAAYCNFSSRRDECMTQFAGEPQCSAILALARGLRPQVPKSKLIVWVVCLLITRRLKIYASLVESWRL